MACTHAILWGACSCTLTEVVTSPQKAEMCPRRPTKRRRLQPMYVTWQLHTLTHTHKDRRQGGGEAMWPTHIPEVKVFACWFPSGTVAMVLSVCGGLFGKKPEGSAELHESSQCHSVCRSQRALSVPLEIWRQRVASLSRYFLYWSASISKMKELLKGIPQWVTHGHHFLVTHSSFFFLIIKYIFRFLLISVCVNKKKSLSLFSPGAFEPHWTWRVCSSLRSERPARWNAGKLWLHDRITCKRIREICFFTLYVHLYCFLWIYVLMGFISSINGHF